MMKFNDLKIGSQLRIGLGAILMFVLLLGTTAYIQTTSLWQEAQGLYEHPLQVRRAIGELEADILVMHNAMKDLTLSENDMELLQILQSIDVYEADAYSKFDILFDRYLGPRNDIDAAHNDFVQWKAIRDETIGLVRAGKIAMAVNNVKPTGPCGSHINKMLASVKVISDFAIARGDKFYQDALNKRDRLVMQLMILLSIILLSTTTIGYYMLKGVRRPLNDLTTVAGNLRKGNLHVRSHYMSANEFGELAASFNTLAESIQKEMQSKENAAHVANVMLREEELHSFSRALLTVLLEHTGSQIGAVFILNRQKTGFEHVDSIGLSAGGRRSFSADEHEGEFGAALATRHIQHITDIPVDSRFVFSSVSGDFLPREILTIPILSGSEIVAVISLANIRNYTEMQVRLVDDVWNVLNARLNGVLAFQHIREFSEKLEGQNRELEAQKQELALQADELSEQNAELEMQKRQLDQASRLKSVFLSNMSHELRTPLNSMIALSSVLRRRLRNTLPEEEYSYIEVIERNGQQLLALINDILDLSRIEAGKEEVMLSRFSVNELVGSILAVMEPQSKDKNIDVVNKVSDDLAITSDPGKCRHILQNIIGNAVKFTDKGTVEITADKDDDSLRIIIKDTGIGISADHVPFIFDEFRQGDESASKKYGGTGLGLSIAKKYAVMLGGAIDVESAPGRGSIFTVRLPLTPPVQALPFTKSRPTVPAVSQTQPSSPAAHGKSILLVEDNEPTVIQMTDILTENGYILQVARNGTQALEQIEKAVPDAMILDLMMPGIDGFQVLQTIRSMEQTAHLPVLILTAKHVTHEELSFLKGNGIRQLIQKGDISKTELLKAVQDLVTLISQKSRHHVKKPAGTRHSGKPVILVVEDNPDNMKTARALLSETAIVIEAVDGREGVVQAKAHKPDIILMDISLPVMDGFKALDEIRKDESLRHTPVIALTASAMKGTREEILGYGFDGYVSKPIDDQVLLETIKEFLYGT
jgi:signal transduction histidine kinase/DNA-binding response OmpR family regulator/HAMP domain-containing protein